MGFEPTTSCLEGKCSTVELLPQSGVRDAEFAVRSIRRRRPKLLLFRIPHSEFRISLEWVERDLNPRIPKEADLQSAAIDHSAIYPCSTPSRASGENRTHDLRFTKPLLYQLSYAGDRFARIRRLGAGRRSFKPEKTETGGGEKVRGYFFVPVPPSFSKYSLTESRASRGRRCASAPAGASWARC